MVPSGGQSCLETCAICHWVNANSPVFDGVLDRGSLPTGDLLTGKSVPAKVGSCKASAEMAGRGRGEAMAASLSAN